MSQRRALQAIVVLLTILVVTTIVPGPFRVCELRDTGLTDDSGVFPTAVYVTECRDSWWPIGARGIGWELPRLGAPAPAARSPAPPPLLTLPTQPATPTSRTVPANRTGYA
jgi:hypothetical protein